MKALISLYTSLFLGCCVNNVQAAAVGVPGCASKDMTLLVYMVNNNNLNNFGHDNFNQMLHVGSTPFVNVLLQMDDFGKKTATRYYIQQNNAIVDASGQHVGLSGTPENLYDFMKWGITQFPAQYYGLIISNHGSGIKDDAIWGRLFLQYKDEFFVINKATGLLEFDKHLAETRIAALRESARGIGYNDETQQYLNNQDLKNTLDKVSLELLAGQKLDIICFDACCMSMVEIASEIKDAAKIMVGSQNVEPGDGYDYAALLRRFVQQCVRPVDFARHVVDMYTWKYCNNYADYTQSAIDMYNFELLEQNISTVAGYLCTLIKTKDFASMLKNIRQSKFTTTEFYDKDYIDILHFYESLLTRCGQMYDFKTTKGSHNKALNFCLWGYERTLNRLKKSLENGILMLRSVKIQNSAGRNLPCASGLSIYFPQQDIHLSYPRTQFAQTTKWLQFLVDYQNIV